MSLLPCCVVGATESGILYQSPICITIVACRGIINLYIVIIYTPSVGSLVVEDNILSAFSNNHLSRDDVGKSTIVISHFIRNTPTTGHGPSCRHRVRIREIDENFVLVTDNSADSNRRIVLAGSTYSDGAIVVARSCCVEGHCDGDGLAIHGNRLVVDLCHGEGSVVAGDGNTRQVCLTLVLDGKGLGLLRILGYETIIKLCFRNNHLRGNHNRRVVDVCLGEELTLIDCISIASKSCVFRRCYTIPCA